VGLTAVTGLWSRAVRAACIGYYRWARADLPHTQGVTSDAMAEVVLKLAHLERPTP
jgi:hypothetical protein